VEVILKSMKRKSDFWTRKITDSIVFTGTLDNRTVTNGGRVLCNSYGNDFQEAIKILSKYRQATF
jgi:hypothetical protein